MKMKFLVLGLVAASVIGLSGCSSSVNSSNNLKSNNVFNSSVGRNTHQEIEDERTTTLKDMEESIRVLKENKCFKDNNLDYCFLGAKYYENKETRGKPYVDDIVNWGYKISFLLFAKKGCDLNSATLCYMTYLTISNNKMDTHRNFDNGLIKKLLGENLVTRQMWAKESLFKACDLNLPNACEEIARINSACEEDKFYIIDWGYQF